VARICWQIRFCIRASIRRTVYGAVDDFSFGDEELLVRVELYLVFGLEGELAVGLSFGKRQGFCL
jgi:hypothetical protein